ncbi:MAG: ORF6N domain-containing protein [Methylobacter sp.]|jgi:hypothetical protein|nr:ORF6N domain-containing protein [Methylobacter sp.]
MNAITLSPETLPSIIWKNQPVITTELLANIYGAKEIQIQQNFNNNTSRFIEGIHYFIIKGTDLKELKLHLDKIEVQISNMVRKLYLWTERGTVRHAKILDTDNAWAVQDRLEDSYFAKNQLQYGLKQLPEPPAITNAQQGELFTIVSNKAHSAGKPHAYFWSRFQNHFKLSSYKLTPAEKFDEAKEYLRKLEGEDKDAFMMLTAKELSSIIRENMDRARVGEVMPKDAIGGVILKFEGDEPQKLLVSVGPLGTSITKLLPDEMVVKKGQFYIMERKDKVSAGKLVLDYIPNEFLPYMIEVAAARLGRVEAGKSQD